MAVQKSSAVLLSSTDERIAMAAEAAENGNISKTPDYHLPWTGPVVEAALLKIMDLDVSGVGGIKVIESSSSTPANLDGLTDPGKYTVNYVTATDFPEDLQGIVPLTVTVYEKDGVLYQLVEGMGDIYVRYSTDSGESWSAWSPKPTNSGGIDTSGEPEVPKPDPIVELTERVSKLETSAAGGVSIGSAEDATKMLAGTYDWDA